MRKNSSSSVAVRGTSAPIPIPACASASDSSGTVRASALNASPAAAVTVSALTPGWLSAISWACASSVVRSS